MNMKHIETGKSGEHEKKKRGRKPKANPKVHNLMIRLNDKERQYFLTMFDRSEKPSYSAFMADCVLNRPLKIVEINKSTIDFVILLNRFFAQYRAVKTNFNQMFDALARNFGKMNALEMIQIVAQSTGKFGLAEKEFNAIVTQLRAKVLNQ
jgi:hypothetical protein